MGQAIFVTSGTQLCNIHYKERKIFERLLMNYKTGHVPVPSVIIQSRTKKKCKKKEKARTPRIICGIKCLN
jgi:hypothetical protein